MAQDKLFGSDGAAVKQYTPSIVAELSRRLGHEPTGSELRAIEVAAQLGLSVAPGDTVKWWPSVRVLKYEPETVRTIANDLGHEPSGPDLRWLEGRYNLVPDAVVESCGNLLTTAGLNRITNLIIGGGGAAFNNAQAFTGVGDSTTTAAVTDTTLNAATNKWYKATDASNPTQSNGVITNNTTFQTTEANYAWQEWVWGVATGTLTAATSLPGTSPILLNHKVQSLGTKASGAVWTLQATVTFS